MTLSELLQKAVGAGAVEAWKATAARELRAFARRSRPFAGVRPTGYYLYIDTKTLQYGLILRGVKPNAASARGFSAPVGKYREVPKYRAYTPYGWRTLDKARDTSGRSGTGILRTHYYGVSGNPTAFFGLKRGGKVEAYGLAGGVAVPVYSDYGFVEWITEMQESELVKILESAGFSAIEQQNRR